jgi:iron complex transport system substrate-binding protein
VRVCSLLPSATEIVADLGLADALVGVAAECRWPPEVIGKPIVTAARLDSQTLSDIEIDAAVRTATADGRSLYTVDADLIAELRPDLIITQDLCAVCAVSSAELASACLVEAEILSLDPRTYRDVAESVRQLGARLGVQAQGERIAGRMEATLAETKRATHDLPPRRVFFAEWLEPPFCAGHWLPEMIAAAGGVDVLGRPGERSFATTWDAVIERRPELVIAGPCGFGVEEATARARLLDLPVEVIAVDGDSYYSRPGPRLGDGVRQLAHLLHPEVVPDPGLPGIHLGRGRVGAGSS